MLLTHVTLPWSSIVADIAALFVRRDSVYKTMAGVDAFDFDRDALTFAGGMAVVAHPPCRGWGRLRQFSHASEQEIALGPWAVDQVQRCGGVLEHPSSSTLFAHCSLPRPGEFPDQFGGWTLAIEQFHWGHRAQKATWLYIVGRPFSDVPAMPFRPGVPTHCVRPTKTHPRLPSITKAEREHTPALLASWLVDLARSCASDSSRRVA